MTITHSYTRLVAVAAGVAVAFALVLGAAAPVRAAALTSTQVSAIVSLLQSFGADAATIANVQASLNGTAPTTPSTPSTGGSMACNASVWTRDLTVGATGADVMALQKFLNMSAATQVAATGAGSPGMETSTFGPATKAAVIKFQTANAITPAAGYVGAITRSAIAAKCGSTPSTPGTGTPSTPTGLSGGEGNLDNFDTIGDVESTVDEGDSDVKVLGIEMDAEDSDISIERVDVDFLTDGGSGSQQLDNYVDSVSLWLDGKKLATKDASDADEDSDVYSFRFSGLNGVIREGKTAQLYVSVDAVSNIDTGDTRTWTVRVPVDGIRAVDAAGISETYDTAALQETGISFDERTGGELKVSEADDNPDADVVLVDEDADTDNVTILAFDLEADEQDITINDLPVGLVTSENEGVDGPVKRVKLLADGKTIDTVSIPSSAGTSYQALFDDLDYTINDGDTVTFEVVVDLNDADPTTFATSSTLYATTTGSNWAWDVEDEEGDDVTPSSSVTGNTFTFETEGIQVKFVSSSDNKSFTADDSGEEDIGEFKIVFDVTALEEDIYLDRTVTADPNRDGSGSAGSGFQWATTSDSTTGTTTVSSVISAKDTKTTDTTTLFKVNAGETRQFTLTVNLSGDIDGNAAVMLTGINWTSTSGDSSAPNFYTSHMDDFKTGLEFIQQI